METKEKIDELLSITKQYELLLKREEERNKELKDIHDRLDTLNDKVDALIENVAEIAKLGSLKTDMTNFKKDTKESFENMQKGIADSFESFLKAYKEIAKEGKAAEIEVTTKKVKGKKLSKSSVNPTAKDPTKRKSVKK